MSIFQMHEYIIDEYRKYVQSFLSIADERVRDYVGRELLERSTLWPDGLLQLNPAYEMAASVEELVRQGKLHPNCTEIFSSQGQALRLYRHQYEALLKAFAQHHYVVTSGTGSGKSLTYLIPIFDHVLKHNPQEPKVYAIIVYPMNALVNSQKEAIDKFLGNLEASQRLVRVGRYTGQEEDDDKQRLRSSPPHVLLTNYVMLELMLTRPEESVFVERGKTALAFLVLDELHTYRGRQGADVAVLIRRLRERCGNPDMLCIGTSATMATGHSRSERNEAAAQFASKLFGVEVEPDNIVEETLRRVIPHGAPPTDNELRRALQQPLPENRWEDFARNPLSAWIEDTFGLQKEADGHLRRRSPITLQEGACQLAQSTGLDEAPSEQRLREMLLLGSRIKTPEGDPVFAFKLHQFIAQGGSVYTTLESPQQRHITLNGQYYAPGKEDRLLYPLVFCRVCGQEYYIVQWDRETKRLSPGPADLLPLRETAGEDEAVEGGYVMLDPDQRWQEGVTALPDHWFDRQGRLKKDYRPFQPRLVFAKSDGEVDDEETAGGLRAWFLKKPFMLCLRCGEAYTLRDTSDFRKLARLSSEGRSTATTLLMLSAVTAMRQTGLDRSAQKVLSFTDNRQDASLQAGHFNDFVQVALLRSALYSALRADGELRFDRIASSVVKTLELPLPEFARPADLDPDSPQAERARQVFQQVVEYRLYEDLRRGWRVVQPNLEQCGLLKVGYEGLEALVLREDVWSGMSFMAVSSLEQRAEILCALLDEMRRQLAIDVECLRREQRDDLRRRANEYLNERWGFDEDEHLRYAPLFVLPGSDVGDGDLSLSRLSVIGRWLREQAREPIGREPDEAEYNRLIEEIISALCRFGLLIEKQESRRRQTVRGVRLRASALTWRLGDGTPRLDRLRRYRATGDVYQVVEVRVNQYFRDFYQGALPSLKGMEGAEHTAQINYERRIEREQRFREGAISSLFCSPTMELGIDITDLNVVHLRNVPPTPANYAQRSGRAGRAGQPALVLAYCASGSGHDQYFFRRRQQMVAGTVVPPRLDLSNEDLLRAHVHAIWLAATGARLKQSVRDVLDTSKENYPLWDEMREQITLSEKRLRECVEECRRVLTACGTDLENAEWFSEQWVEETVRLAANEFDRAFDRWREFFRLAWNQLLEAQRLQQQVYLGRSPSRQDEPRDPVAMEREARRQLDLLCCQNTKRDESDFYPYRYLASEGFLPGYNFPALPVRAYISRGSEGEFIARPRFLALTEFGPHNVIYHEGAKYQVKQALLPVQEPERRFVRAKFCQGCGYVHEGATAHDDLCRHCGVQLTGDTSLLLPNLLEMPTASTRRRERITCDEEERLRWGYEVTTHFRFALAPGDRTERRQAGAVDAEGARLLDLTYAPAATLWRINHHWKQTREPGFRLDLRRGVWLGQAEPKNESAIGLSDVRSNVRLFVRATANAMLIYPPPGEKSDGDSCLGSLQYALTRGIQAVFQVEESELASERIGKDENRGVLLWEAAEGGLGVLRRLVEEPTALSEVARAALDILHFDPATAEDRRPADLDTPNGCARACYDCLLSYYNQRDHRMLDRHTVREFLWRLTQSVTRVGGERRSYDEHYRWLRTLTDARSELERQFLDQLYATKRRLPDDAQHKIPDIGTIPDFFYEPNVCIFCDGRVHDEPQQRVGDERVRRQLKDGGYRVIVVRYDAGLEEQISPHSEVFGEGSR